MRQFTETLRTLRMSLIDIAKVLKQVWVMGRVAGKPKVVAFQQQRRRPACADAQTGQRLCCSISVIDKLVIYKQNFSILANLRN